MTTQKLSRLDIESLPNYKKKTAREWSSTCPNCGGVDRFLYWPEVGNYYCRQCETQGFVLEVDKQYLTQEQRDAWQRAADERRRKEAEARLSAIERLQRMGDKVGWYHGQVCQALDYWHGQGLSEASINYYQLGYCPACPVEPESPSYVIPYFCQSKLVNLRHRLKFPNGHGKYRPEFAGLGNHLFNLDTLAESEDINFGILDSGLVVLVEGEVKTMVLEQVGFKTVGIPGASSWQDDWTTHFKSSKGIYIVLDPGAEQQAERIAISFKGHNIRSKVVYLPVKPDDFFVLYRGRASEFVEFLKLGRRV